MSTSRNRRRLATKNPTDVRSAVAALSRYSSNLHILLMRAVALSLARAATSTTIQLSKPPVYREARVAMCPDPPACAVLLSISDEPSQRALVVETVSAEVFEGIQSEFDASMSIMFSPGPKGQVMFRSHFRGHPSDEMDAFKKIAADTMRLIAGAEV